MQEVLGVAVVQPLHQLPSHALDVHLRELAHAGVEQPHQVVVAVLEHQVERTCTRSGRGRQGESHPCLIQCWSSESTVEPLLKDTPEIRTLLSIEQLAMSQVCFLYP